MSKYKPYKKTNSPLYYQTGGFNMDFFKNVAGNWKKFMQNPDSVDSDKYLNDLSTNSTNIRNKRENLQGQLIFPNREFDGWGDTADAAYTEKIWEQNGYAQKYGDWKSLTEDQRYDAWKKHKYSRPGWFNDTKLGSDLHQSGAMYDKDVATRKELSGVNKEFNDNLINIGGGIASIYSAQKEYDKKPQEKFALDFTNDKGIMRSQGGGYSGKVDSILNANKHLNWVKRLYDKDPKSIMIPGEDEPSTHFMESSADDTGGIVYPTVIQHEDGTLEYLGDKARDHAIKTKTYIKFPTDAEAQQFGKEYKKGTGVLRKNEYGGLVESYKKGGPVGYGYNTGLNKFPFLGKVIQPKGVSKTTSKARSRYPYEEPVTSNNKVLDDIIYRKDIKSPKEYKGKLTRDEVISVQRQLNRQNNTALKEDGRMGPKTLAAIEAYKIKKTPDAGKANLFRTVTGFLPKNVSQLAAKEILGDARMNDDSLSDDEKKVLYNVIRNAQKRTGSKKGGTEYKDYGDLGYGTAEEFEDNFNRGKAGDSIFKTIKESYTNPGFRLASTIGRGSFNEDDEYLYYTDVYDWNKSESNYKDDNLYKQVRNKVRDNEEVNNENNKFEKFRMNFKLRKADFENKDSINYQAGGGVPTSPLGLYQYPGQMVNVPSGRITMRDINYPVLALPNNNKPEVMYPGKEYEFEDSDSVLEVPMMEFGGGDYPYTDYDDLDDEDVKDQIKKHEGSVVDKYGKHISYADSRGFKTIGYGHLWKKGDPTVLTQKQAEDLFNKDYRIHKKHAENIPGYHKANSNQKKALINLTYNMGANWYKKFPKFTKAFEDGNHVEAAEQLKNSKWAKQVGKRSDDVINTFLTDIPVQQTQGNIAKVYPTNRIEEDVPQVETRDTRPVTERAFDFLATLKQQHKTFYDGLDFSSIYNNSENI
jgi:lysozyme